MDRDGDVRHAARSRRGSRSGARSSSPTASRRSRSASCTPIATRRTSRRRAALIAREFPDLCGLAVVRGGGGAARISSAAVTTCANAYVQPLMDRYLAKLRARTGGARIPRRAAADAFGRRPGLARDRARLSDPPARSPARPAAVWPPRCSATLAGKRGRDLLRHGRHHREGLPDRGRPRRNRADDGSGARAPLQARLRPADQGAGDRHDRDRRRRRLDRRRSTRSGCCASARIRPAPIPDPPATAAAAPSRR